MRTFSRTARFVVLTSLAGVIISLSACEGLPDPGLSPDAGQVIQDASTGPQDAGVDKSKDAKPGVMDAGIDTKPDRIDAGVPLDATHGGDATDATDANKDTWPDAMAGGVCPANLAGGALAMVNGGDLTYGITVQATVAVPIESLTISGINMTGAGYVRANLYQSGVLTPFASGAITITAAGSDLTVVLPISPTLIGSTPMLTPGVPYVIGVYVSGGASTTSTNPHLIPCTVPYGSGNIWIEGSLQSSMPGEMYPGDPSQSTPQIQFNGSPTLGGAGEGSACTDDSMCGTGYCNTLTQQCVAGQSCKAMYPYAALGTDTMAGLDSCGSGESTDPTQVHESCCRSLLLPPSSTQALPMKMDKYEVTAGRMRQFIEAMHVYSSPDNIQAWALAQVAASTTYPSVGYFLVQQMSAESIALLPTSADPTADLNIPVQLGATTMDSNVPSDEQGCWMGPGAYGASTYFEPGSVLSSVGSPARLLDQAQYDIKSMNCGTYMMYAAFCAWDGGRLPTVDEVAKAWGPGQYPWSTAIGLTAPFIPTDYPVTAPYVLNGIVGANSTLASQGATVAVTQTANWNNNSYLGFSGHFYMYPNGGSLLFDPVVGGKDLVTSGLDLTPFIASPGRFQQDVTLIKSVSFAETEGWQDLAANMLEMTMASTVPGNGLFCDCATASSAELSAAVARGSGTTVGDECSCPSAKQGVVRSDTMPSSEWMGGSWEGHTSANALAATSLGYPWLSMEAGFNYPLQTQYGKTGLRCVRPVLPAAPAH